MRYLTAINAFVAFTAATSPLFAQSHFDRELQQLKEQRDKSLAAAADAINRRYQSALEQLLGRATQAKDLESALKVREELRVLAVSGTSAMPDTSSLTAKPKTGSDLVARLPGTSWFWGVNQSMKFTFLPGGRFDGHFKGASWRALSPELIYYAWGDNAYSGVMRVAKDFERLDAAEWQSGKPAPIPVFVSKASK